MILPTRTLLTTEDTENTEENQWHGGIRGANGAGQKQKLCKQACPIFAFFSAHPSLLGAIRANLRNPWIVSFHPSSSRGLLKTFGAPPKDDARFGNHRYFRKKAANFPRKRSNRSDEIAPKIPAMRDFG